MLKRIQEIRERYARYEEEFLQLERNRRAGAGAFGLSGGPRDYPCHEQFAGDMERLLKEASNAYPEEAAEILDYVWFAPLAREERQDAVYWMEIAVHGMTEGLAGRLSPSDAGRLLERYEAAYPRRDRLPVQKKVISALKKRAKNSY